MDYKVAKDDGTFVWYKLLGGNVVPTEVSHLVSKNSA